MTIQVIKLHKDLNFHQVVFPIKQYQIIVEFEVDGKTLDDLMVYPLDKIGRLFRFPMSYAETATEYTLMTHYPKTETYKLRVVYKDTGSYELDACVFGFQNQEAN